MRATVRDFSIVAAAVAMLDGCSGSQAPIIQAGGPVTSLRSAQRHLAGGAFNASFSGSFTSACGQYGPGFWKFHGKGSASFLGSSHERGYFKLVFAFGCIIQGGKAILRSERSGDTISVSFSAAQYSPCSGSGAAPYKVRGGTGKFSDATGGGTVSFSCSAFGSDYTDAWSGTLYY